MPGIKVLNVAKNTTITQKKIRTLLSDIRFLSHHDLAVRSKVRLASLDSCVLTKA